MEYISQVLIALLKQKRQYIRAKKMMYTSKGLLNWNFLSGSERAENVFVFMAIKPNRTYFHDIRWFIQRFESELFKKKDHSAAFKFVSIPFWKTKISACHRKIVIARKVFQRIHKIFYRNFKIFLFVCLPQWLQLKAKMTASSNPMIRLPITVFL